KSLRFAVQGEKPNPASISFVVSDDSGAWELKTEIAAVTASPGVSSAAPEAKTQDWTTYFILLLSAFVGGIILNLMPCVLPVLSIKFFSLAKVSPQTRFREAMLYTLGVLVTFTGLGALFLALRAGGAAIGWGFQLQSPPIVTALIVLFFVMGLSFLGFFEFGNSLTRAAGKFENTGAFATGCLSVFVATPCTGPFMGTALGAAATLPAIQALIIFFALGLGLASPFLALAFFPKLRLPRPGNWMIVLRQVLAFPLFATVIWLLWVLGMQLGSDAWLYITSLGLLLSFAIWLAKERSMPYRVVAVLIALAGVIYTGRWVISAPLASATAKATEGKVAWLDYDPSLIKESAARKQAVFVDFTASWCVTCQVNKKAVLETDAADKIFAANNVRLIRGDWTNLDDKITTALAEFNRASVPLYLFYPADGGKPQILPQILQLSDIESLFTTNQGN
ncbi:MAG: glucan 1,4-alpha-glucosidase, partial [Proteobacteria bacterium]